MNSKHYLPLLITLILATSLQAKIVIDERKIEPAIIEVLYKRIKVTDTLLVNTDFKTDYLTLMAGKNSSAFYCADRKTNDSISNRNPQYAIATMLDKEAFRRASEYEVESLFKNFPKGKVTNHTRHSLCSWTYEEDWEKPTWEITDSISTIGGYECMLAVSDYRGRRWYAWFTPEIAISEGPWKLCGLPGLILEAHDEKSDYHYTATGIIQDNIPDVGIYNYSEYDWLITDRIRYLKTWYKANNTNMGAKVSQMYNLDLKAAKGTPQKMKHRNYDLEERDYQD